MDNRIREGRFSPSLFFFSADVESILEGERASSLGTTLFQEGITPILALPKFPHPISMHLRQLTRRSSFTILRGSIRTKLQQRLHNLLVSRTSSRMAVCSGAYRFLLYIFRSPPLSAK